LKLKVSFKFGRLRLWLGCALLGACLGGRALPVAGAGDVARGVKRFPDLTRTELDEGRLLFANRCGSCHRPPRPRSKQPDEWPGHIREMRERARLSDDEIRLIERYVVTMALAPAQTAQADDLPALR